MLRLSRVRVAFRIAIYVESRPRLVTRRCVRCLRQIRSRLRETQNRMTNVQRSRTLRPCLAATLKRERSHAFG